MQGQLVCNYYAITGRTALKMPYSDSPKLNSGGGGLIFPKGRKMPLSDFHRFSHSNSAGGRGLKNISKGESLDLLFTMKLCQRGRGGVKKIPRGPHTT